MPETAQTNINLMEDEYKVILTADESIAGQPKPSYWTKKIVAILPEDGLSLETSAQYSQPLSLGAQAANNIAQLWQGQALHVKELGKNFWDKTEPITMSLSLQFVTWQDPYIDVVKPALTLNSLPLPAKKSDNLVVAPVQVNKTGNLASSVTIDIGPLGIFPVLPQSTSVSFSGTLCESPSSNKNWPVSADVDFTFKIAQKPTKQSLGTRLLGKG